MNTSLVLTCVPFLKPLMEALQPGWSTSDIVQGVGYNFMYGKSGISSGKYPLGSVIGGQTVGSKSKPKVIMHTVTLELESRDDNSGQEPGWSGAV